MIAGTLAIGGEAGDLPGYLMGRGTIMLGRGATLLSPTFGDCGEYELVAHDLWLTTSREAARNWRSSSAVACGASQAISPRSARGRFASAAVGSATG